MAAAASQLNVPARAADDYVRNLFDESARSFDADLERLRYRGPQAVAAALLRTAGTRLLSDVLDAGCGTGLCGPLARAHCGRLVGVDLSAQMIERARERGCYDELVVAELMAFMRSRSRSFDGLISADTLVYFGALEEPLRAAHEALRAGGVLVFTLEALPSDANVDYRLETHGRYAHAENYIRRAIAAAGLTLDTLCRENLREERGMPVASYLVTARK
jgi:predicted TPR repeat methyltransferase